MPLIKEVRGMGKLLVAAIVVVVGGVGITAYKKRK